VKVLLINPSSDTYEDSWYKGKPGFYKSTVSTSHLSSEEIISFRNEIEKRFKKNTGVFLKEGAKKNALQLDKR